MFDKFKTLFSSDSLLDQAYNTTLTMLEFDQRMFLAARETLRETDTDELPFDLHTMDRQINRYQQEVRQMVLTHLAVAGSSNLVPGLALVSIVIDVERIGDYTKNMTELAEHHKERLSGYSHEAMLSDIEKQLIEIFPQTITVLKDQDTAAARGIMASERELARNSEKIVSAMILDAGSEVPNGDAVCLALYARYLKRIDAHLTNIASSIVNPFPRIGFRELRDD